jgi:hypothetical protein
MGAFAFVPDEIFTGAVLVPPIFISMRPLLAGNPPIPNIPVVCVSPIVNNPPTALGFTLLLVSPKVKALGVVFVNVVAPPILTALDAEPIETVLKLVDAVDILTPAVVVPPVFIFIAPLRAPSVPILRIPLVCVVAIF